MVWRIGALVAVIAIASVQATDTLGDVNCDGNVSSLDAALILQFSADLIQDFPCPESDVDGDGESDAIDASLILQFSAGLISKPEPTPTPGPSPTPTALVCCNDNFADAFLIDSFPFTGRQSTLGATEEPDENLRPEGCALSGTEGTSLTVWYTFVAPASTMFASTANSDFDTVLALYTDSLIVVGCDDDSGPGRTSELTASLTQGVTYYLQAGGFNGSAGDLVLTVR